MKYSLTVSLESRILIIVFNKSLHNIKDNKLDKDNEWVWISWEQKIKESHFAMFFEMKKLNFTLHDVDISSSCSMRWSIFNDDQRSMYYWYTINILLISE